MVIDLLIEGMSCEHCVKRVENALKEIKGVDNVLVNLSTNSAQVTGNNVDENDLMNAVEEAGYKAKLK